MQTVTSGEDPKREGGGAAEFSTTYLVQLVFGTNKIFSGGGGGGGGGT